jgi:succinate dehydrogenase / fumarate reductase cytochrome b subunit
MTLSILHRVTGVALSLGFVVFVAWLFAAASGAESYAVLLGAMQSTIGRLLLIGCSFAFFFHLSNGVRHLFWDTGRGLAMRQANASAWFVLFASAVSTAGFWMMLS